MKAGLPYHRFQRKRKINWYGSTCFFLYVVAFFFYMYIRITKTMDLGSYIACVPSCPFSCLLCRAAAVLKLLCLLPVSWVCLQHALCPMQPCVLRCGCCGCRYGVYVLIVEILGAISTVLYGVNLLWDPVNEEPPADPNDPALPLVRCTGGPAALSRNQWRQIALSRPSGANAHQNMEAQQYLSIPCWPALCMAHELRPGSSCSCTWGAGERAVPCAGAHTLLSGAPGHHCEDHQRSLRRPAARGLPSHHLRVR